MKYSFILPVALLTLLPTEIVAETWNLEQCVAYAIENNLTVKSRKLNIMEGEQQITEAKDRFLPSVSASAGKLPVGCVTPVAIVSGAIGIPAD